MTEDEQEAASRKYCAPQVVPLSSGNFAIYNLYTINEGLELNVICSEADLPTQLRRFIAAIEEQERQQEAAMQEILLQPSVKKSIADLLADIGL